MPAALAEARVNLQNPPRVYTEIAIAQVDGNREFFETAVASAFPTVTDKALLTEFAKANGTVIAALAEYKKWLEHDLLPRSNGSFAFGEDASRRKLAADEMIELPFEELLHIAERDLRRNQLAFAETARRIDPVRAPRDVQKALEANHRHRATSLDDPGRAGFTGLVHDKKTDRHDSEGSVGACRRDTPFLRATTSASIEIPGPFERVATETSSNMTLPDPKATAAAKNEFMTQWYFPMITNVSVHEVWPGHYLQYLYARDFPSDIRKVLGAASDGEILAEMVIDEGFHARRSALSAGAAARRPA